MSWYARRITDQLLIVEDRHAERALREALAPARLRGASAAVLTGDALLAMRLRREGIDARLTTDGLTPDLIVERDRAMLDGVTRAAGKHAEAMGTNFGPYLQYTLIPSFSRAVRNVTAIDDELTRSAPGRLVLVGGGPLVDAARLVASRRGLTTEIVGGDVLQRAAQAFARLRAGRATKWVNTEFRALVLEPGFIWLTFFTGLWRRIARGAMPSPGARALIVVGDRFTADVVERLQGAARPIVIAGATQPGRALFQPRDLIPLEAFTDLVDPIRWLGALADAVAQALSLSGDRAHAGQFTVAGVPYWPLVGRTVWLHIAAWVPALRHLQSLTDACAGGRVLTSSDVTAYNRVLIDTARRFGVASTGIQHGITGEPNGHSVAHVDRLATWGDWTETWYRAQGAQTASFVVTGNPRFDALAARVGSRESGVGSQSPATSHQAPATFTVTICSGFMTDYSMGASEYENLLMIDAVLAWARTQTDVRVIHKMHPGEEAEYYAEAARALGWDPLTLTTIREPILYDILEKSHVLVAAYSTTVLESIALGTPAIVFDAVFRRKLLPLDRVPGIAIAYSIEELGQQLTARRAGAAGLDRGALARSAELRAYVSELDGHATDRVAALVAETR
ncbi:MAG: hypothetical protein LAO77_10190 [Acidobacteriia bacterium]|nr:hypothetical protein [Terriglobia bacterium]